ncbi:hypothetical protein BJV82DRAFT_665772 [Fennellomyces sp. T-0311]|nr:hypothetical protein BJV82DRAFT_665772 [Fennellomyces sp. T-0311]
MIQRAPQSLKNVETSRRPRRNVMNRGINDAFELDFGDDNAALASTPPNFFPPPVSEDSQLPNINLRRPSFSGTYTVASTQLTASDRTAINWANLYDDLREAYLGGTTNGGPDLRTYELVTRRSTCSVKIPDVFARPIR